MNDWTTTGNIGWAIQMAYEAGKRGDSLTGVKWDKATETITLSGVQKHITTQAVEDESNDSEWITSTFAAFQESVSERTIYNYIKQGRYLSKRVNGRTYVKKATKVSNVASLQLPLG